MHNIQSPFYFSIFFSFLSCIFHFIMLLHTLLHNAKSLIYIAHYYQQTQSDFSRVLLACSIIWPAIPESFSSSRIYWCLSSSTTLLFAWLICHLLSATLPSLLAFTDVPCCAPRCPACFGYPRRLTHSLNCPSLTFRFLSATGAALPPHNPILSSGWKLIPLITSSFSNEDSWFPPHTLTNLLVTSFFFDGRQLILPITSPSPPEDSWLSHPRA